MVGVLFVVPMALKFADGLWGSASGGHTIVVVGVGVRFESNRA